MMNLRACILLGAVSLTPVFAASDACREEKINFCEPCQDPLTDGFVHVGPNEKEGIHHIAVTPFGQPNPDGTQKLRRHDPKKQVGAVKETVDNIGLKAYEGNITKGVLQIIADIGDIQKEMWWNTQTEGQLKQTHDKKPCLPLLWRIQRTAGTETPKWLSTICVFDVCPFGYIMRISFYDECGKRILFYPADGHLNKRGITLLFNSWGKFRPNFWTEKGSEVLIGRTHDGKRFLHMHLQSFYQTQETQKLTEKQEKLQQEIRKFFGLPKTYAEAKSQEIEIEPECIKDYEEELGQQLAKERAIAAE